MLFCFGLFALLLYYTVVANAECSYTYRNTSRQHIEAQSSDYERQGFRRCEFLIQLVDHQQQLELNFTRLSGFGQHSPSDHEQREGEPWAKEAQEEEEEGGEEKSQTHGGARTSSQSQRPRFVTSTTRAPVAVEPAGSGSKLSPIVSSSSSPTAQRAAAATTTTTTGLVYANTNIYSKTMAGPPPSSPLTTASSQQGRPRGRGSAPCLPMVEIREVVGEGREETRHRICRQRHNTQTPIVFHYASSVRIVYEWEQEQSSGFTLYFDFSSSEHEKCVHSCDGSRCLTEARLLCDGHADCTDQSDERLPACSLQSSAAASGPIDADSLVKIIVIPSCVLVAIVLGVVCLIGRRRWYSVHRTMHRGNGHAAHLTCPQSHSSEGLTPSACSTQDCNEQAVALLSSDHRGPHKSWYPPAPHTHPLHPPHPPPDPEVGLPPNIPVSPDGEEGYSTSQLRLLHSRCYPPHSHLFKPPPNKTVFDRESPPPYSLTPSPGTYGCGSAPPFSPPQGLRRGGGCLPEHVRVVRDSDGNAVVTRCYTMFTPSGGRRPHPHPQHPHLHHDTAATAAAAAAAAPAPAPSRDDRRARQHLGERPHPSHNNNNNNNNNNNGFAGHYQQPSTHVHGAFTVKDALHPSPPAPSLGKSCPPGHSSAATAASSSSPPSPPTPPPSSSSSSSSSPPPPPPPAQTVSASGSLCASRSCRDSDSGGGGGGGSESHQGKRWDELGAPPSYELAFSQGGGVGVENSHSVVANTNTPSTNTSTPSTNTNAAPSGV